MILVFSIKYLITLCKISDTEILMSLKTENMPQKFNISILMCYKFGYRSLKLVIKHILRIFSWKQVTLHLKFLKNRPIIPPANDFNS